MVKGPGMEKHSINKGAAVRLTTEHQKHQKKLKQENSEIQSSEFRETVTVQLELHSKAICQA